MTEKEVKENLCWYDPRNPDYANVEQYKYKGECNCDNCFYGKTKLAKEILSLMEEKKETINAIMKIYPLC